MPDPDFGSAAERWSSALFSTAPVDRSVVEQSLADMYTAVGLSPPRHLLWFDSPLEACWAVGLLNEDLDFLAINLAKSMKTKKVHLAKVDQVQRGIVTTTGASSWEAAKDQVGSLQTATKLTQMGSLGISAPTPAVFPQRIATARVELFAGNIKGMMEPLPPPLEKLHRQFEALFGRHGEGVLGRQAIADGAGSFATWIRRSLWSDYHHFGIAQMASDETRGQKASPLLTSLWKLVRNCGPCWLYDRAVVLTAHPVEVHRNANGDVHNEGGPAMVYPDGWKVFASNGAWPREEQKKGPPVRSTASQARSKLLAIELPRDPEQRLAILRKHSPDLPLFDRYMAGEHETVWKELVQRAGEVRSDPLCADALAVAYETMHRVQQNAVTLIARLRAAGYRFTTAAGQAEKKEREVSGIFAQASEMAKQLSAKYGSKLPPGLEMLMGATEAARKQAEGALQASKTHPKDKNDHAHTPPDAKTWKRIQKVEKSLGTIPLSLRAFYDVVGGIDLSGEHPSIAPDPDLGPVSVDPLVIYDPADALQAAEVLEEENDSRVYLFFDADYGSYDLELPNEGADGMIREEPRKRYFVDYLRHAFQLGGFPGWERHDAIIPPEIEQLRQGLVAF